MPADPQAQACAAFALGGEERLEEMVAYVGGDSRAVVCNLDDRSGFHAVAGWVWAGCLRDDADGGTLHRRRRPQRHVGDEIGEDLAELGGESFDGDLWRLGGDLGRRKRVEAAFHEQEQFVEGMSFRDTGTGAWDSR